MSAWWNGGTGETRTRITRVRTGDSPFELQPRGTRRNRTFSPGFGGPAGHHDSCAPSRPVGESNPSHSRDSGAATPVASRAIFIEGDGRESNPPPQVHS